MIPEEYIKQRVDDQIQWYSNKSRSSKYLFILFKITEIVLALSITILGSFAHDSTWNVGFAISLIGAVIAALAGILALLKVQENWIEYRATAEALKHEKFFFLTRAGDYDKEGAFELFVERFERLISKENSNWVQHWHKKEQVNTVSV